MYRRAGCLLVSGLLLGLVDSLVADPAFALEADEPGLELLYDEPGLTVGSPLDAHAHGSVPWVKIGARFGLSSLVVDPDLSLGILSGIDISVRMAPSLWLELGVSLAWNDYKRSVSSIGSPLLDTFWAGNISLGVAIPITGRDSRLVCTVDAGGGAYAVLTVLQRIGWTLGLWGGFSIGYRLNPWLSVGLKPRYHLFNLATFSGESPLDRLSLQKLGVIDRLEVPIYGAVSF